MQEFDFDTHHVVVVLAALVRAIVTTSAAVEQLFGARSATRSAGPIGAIVSVSATIIRIGQRMLAAFLTGRCAPIPSRERAATRLCQSVPLGGVMSDRPAMASALAIAPNSPGAALAVM